MIEAVYLVGVFGVLFSAHGLYRERRRRFYASMFDWGVENGRPSHEIELLVAAIIRQERIIMESARGVAMSAGFLAGFLVGRWT